MPLAEPVEHGTVGLGSLHDAWRLAENLATATFGPERETRFERTGHPARGTTLGW